MAITFERLQELLKGEGLKFYIDPDRPLARLMLTGTFGRYDMAVVLDDEGQFLQLRTLGYGTCPKNHQHHAALLRLLAEINYVRRFVKFGLDPADGELVGYGDLWIMDGQVTQQQFHRMMANFVPGIDVAHARIEAVLATGKDPGDEVLQNAPQPGGRSGPGEMPPALKEVLKRLEKRTGGGGEKKAGGEGPVSAI